MAAAARALRSDGTLLITVAAERLVSLFNEMQSISNEPYSRYMFVTPTLSTIMNLTSAVLNVTCDGILHCTVVLNTLYTTAFICFYFITFVSICLPAPNSFDS